MAISDTARQYFDYALRYVPTYDNKLQTWRERKRYLDEELNRLGVSDSKEKDRIAREYMGNEPLYEGSFLTERLPEALSQGVDKLEQSLGAQAEFAGDYFNNRSLEEWGRQVARNKRQQLSESPQFMEPIEELDKKGFLRNIDDYTLAALSDVIGSAPAAAAPIAGGIMGGLPGLGLGIAGSLAANASMEGGGTFSDYKEQLMKQGYSEADAEREARYAAKKVFTQNITDPELLGYGVAQGAAGPALGLMGKIGGRAAKFTPRKQALTAAGVQIGTGGMQERRQYETTESATGNPMDRFEGLTTPEGRFATTVGMFAEGPTSLIEYATAKDNPANDPRVDNEKTNLLKQAQDASRAAVTEEDLAQQELEQNRVSLELSKQRNEEIKQQLDMEQQLQRAKTTQRKLQVQEAKARSDLRKILEAGDDIGKQKTVKQEDKLNQSIIDAEKDLAELKSLRQMAEGGVGKAAESVRQNLDNNIAKKEQDISRMKANRGMNQYRKDIGNTQAGAQDDIDSLRSLNQQIGALVTESTQLKSTIMDKVSKGEDVADEVARFGEISRLLDNPGGKGEEAGLIRQAENLQSRLNPVGDVNVLGGPASAVEKRQLQNSATDEAMAQILGRKPKTPQELFEDQLKPAPPKEVPEMNLKTPRIYERADGTFTTLTKKQEENQRDIIGEVEEEERAYEAEQKELKRQQIIGIRDAAMREINDRLSEYAGKGKVTGMKMGDRRIKPTITILKDLMEGNVDLSGMSSEQLRILTKELSVESRAEKMWKQLVDESIAERTKFNEVQRLNRLGDLAAKRKLKKDAEEEWATLVESSQQERDFMQWMKGENRRKAAREREAKKRLQREEAVTENQTPAEAETETTTDDIIARLEAEAKAYKDQKSKIAEETVKLADQLPKPEQKTGKPRVTANKNVKKIQPDVTQEVIDRRVQEFKEKGGDIKKVEAVPPPSPPPAASVEQQPEVVEEQIEAPKATGRVRRKANKTAEADTSVVQQEREAELAQEEGQQAQQVEEETAVDEEEITPEEMAAIRSFLDEQKAVAKQTNAETLNQINAFAQIAIDAETDQKVVNKYQKLQDAAKKRMEKLGITDYSTAVDETVDEVVADEEAETEREETPFVDREEAAAEREADETPEEKPEGFTVAKKPVRLPEDEELNDERREIEMGSSGAIEDNLDRKEKERSALEAQMAAFLARGGKVTKIDSQKGPVDENKVQSTSLLSFSKMKEGGRQPISSPTRLTQAQAQAALVGMKRVLRNLDPNNEYIKIFNDAESAHRYLKQLSQQQGMDFLSNEADSMLQSAQSGELVEGFVIPVSNEIVLIADQIIGSDINSAIDRMVEVTFHEAIGHRGLRGLMRENYKQFIEKYGSKNRGAINRWLQTPDGKSYIDNPEFVQTEEYIARNFAEFGARDVKFTENLIQSIAGVFGLGKYSNTALKRALKQVENDLAGTGGSIIDGSNVGFIANSNNIDDDLERDADPREYRPEELTLNNSRKDYLDALQKTGLIHNSRMAAKLGPYPDYLNSVVNAMQKMQGRFNSGNLRVRDVAKGYFITISSMGKKEQPRTTIEAQLKRQIPGFTKLPDIYVENYNGKEVVRPEEQAAWALTTDLGQQLLKDLENGNYDEKGWMDLATNYFSRTYGRNDLTKPGYISGKSAGKGMSLGQAQELTDAVNAKPGNVDNLYEQMGRFQGIGEGKTGFISSLFGVGGMLTMDAVELNAWFTGQGDITPLTRAIDSEIGINQDPAILGIKADLDKEIQSINENQELTDAQKDKQITNVKKKSNAVAQSERLRIRTDYLGGKRKANPSGKPGTLSKEQKDRLRARYLFKDANADDQASLREIITQKFGEIRDDNALESSQGMQGIPKDLFEHIVHHWTWDNYKGAVTRHEGIYEAMLNYSRRVDEVDSKLTSGELYGDSTLSFSKRMLDKAGLPPKLAEELAGKKMVILTADRTKYGKYNGLNPGSEIDIFMYGGPGYGENNVETGAAWASADRAANTFYDHASKFADRGLFGVVLLKPENHMGSKNVFLAFIEELKEGKKLGTYDWNSANLQAEKLAKSAAVVGKFPDAPLTKDIIELFEGIVSNVGHRERPSMIKPIWNASEKLKSGWNATGVSRIGRHVLKETTDARFLTTPYGAMVGLGQVDTKRGGVLKASDLGITEHPSYNTVIPGKFTTFLKNPVPIFDYGFDWILRKSEEAPNTFRIARDEQGQYKNEFDPTLLSEKGSRQTVPKQETSTIQSFMASTQGSLMEVSPNVIKQVPDDAPNLSYSRKQRNQLLQEAAKALKAGDIKTEEYQRLVDQIDPIKPLREKYLDTPDDGVPNIATQDEMEYALKSDQVSKILGKPGVTLTKGDKVALRLDIPAYDTHDVWIVSVHNSDKIDNKGNLNTLSLNGDVKAYAPTARAIGTAETGRIEFKTQSPMAALNIAAGKPKQTIARMFGRWVEHDPQTLRDEAAQLLNDPKSGWVEVGMNPIRASYFYRKDTGMPVVSAAEVIQVGSLVLARDVETASKTDPRFQTKNAKGEVIYFSKRLAAESVLDAVEKQANRTMDMLWSLPGLKQADQGLQYLQDKLTPMSSLPNIKEYLAARRRLRGVIDRNEDIAKLVYKAFEKSQNPQQIYKFMTTKNADPKSITNGDERAMALRVKQAIEDIGDRLVRTGLLDQSTVDAMRGEYLPRVYMKYLLKDEDADFMMSNNRRPSDLSYIMERKDIPEGVRRLILGQIEDPAYLASRALMQPGRDLAIIDWLSWMADRPEWTLQQTLTEFDMQGRMREIANRVGGAGLVAKMGVQEDRTKKRQAISDNIAALRDEIKQIKKENIQVPVKNQQKLLQAKNAELKELIKERDKLPTNYRVSPFYLKSEVERIQRQVLQNENSPASDMEKEVLRQLLDEMKLAADNKIKEIDVATLDPKQWKQIPKSRRYGKLQGMVVRKEIYDDIIGGFKMMTGDESGAEKILGDTGYIAKASQLWKWSKVAANPPSYVRNSISNMILMNLGGVRMHRIPGLIAKAFNAYSTNSPYYQLAKKHGLLSSGFNGNEIQILEQEFLTTQRRKAGMEGQMSGLHAMRVARELFGKLQEKTGNAYGYVDGFGKIMMMIDGMESQGMNEADAAAYAEKWLFDYSNVTPSVRYLRNAPLGSPFITFTTKVAPLMLEVARNHPWRFAPWIGLGYAMTEAVKSAFDWDDDDVEAAFLSLPKYLREKGQTAVVPLPFKDENGRIQFLDISYLLPWGIFQEIGNELARGDFGDALMTTGILSGPIMNIGSAIQNNRDSFTGREIIDRTKSPAEQMGDLFMYMYNFAVPPLLNTDYGGIYRMKQALNEDLDKYGQPTFTVGQAAGRMSGINITPVDIRQSRSDNIRRLERELANLKRDKTRDLRSARRMQKDREEIQKITDDYNELINDKRNEMIDYRKRSRLPINA